MRCPFGEEVGAPPSMYRCPRGFPGCACGDEVMFAGTDEETTQTLRVWAWWSEHLPDDDG